MANLENLSLHVNAIGDVGMQAFASAVASGFLPKLYFMSVARNPGDVMGVKAACSARGILF